MSDEICRMSLCEVSEAIRRRRLSSLEATRACLARIEKLHPALNCFISLEAEEALAQARRADAALARGRDLGPLHGVPLAHKDLFARRGKGTTAGSRFLGRRRETRTATVLVRLKHAGAVTVGTLHMAEFALNPTGLNDTFGDCRNPWSLDRITGGSSSGSACAVAARLIYGSLGSDTAGSIRLPAAMCGIIGLKPTQTLVSRFSVFPVSFSADTVGPMARTVRDCARLLAIIAGHDANDATSSRRRFPDYESELSRLPKGIRLGVARNYFLDGIAKDIEAQIKASLDVFRHLGEKVVELDVPDPSPIDALCNTVFLAEAATTHGAWLRQRPEDYMEASRERLVAGLCIPASYYIEALSRRGRVAAEFSDSVFRRCNALLTPIFGRLVPRIDELRSGRGRKSKSDVDIPRNTRAFNYLGLPALSVPCGFSDDGLPVGFQLIGPPFSEVLLLGLGHAFQSATDYHLRCPTLCVSNQRVAELKL